MYQCHHFGLTVQWFSVRLMRFLVSLRSNVHPLLTTNNSMKKRSERFLVERSAKKMSRFGFGSTSIAVRIRNCYGSISHPGYGWHIHANFRAVKRRLLFIIIILSLSSSRFIRVLFLFSIFGKTVKASNLSPFRLLLFFDPDHSSK